MNEEQNRLATDPAEGHKRFSQAACSAKCGHGFAKESHHLPERRDGFLPKLVKEKNVRVCPCVSVAE